MKKVFDYIKKHLIFSVFVIFVLIPVFIYFLSTVPFLPSGGNDWAGFWGGYVGAIIGGICTVIGVYWTIEYSQESYKEDVRNRTLPYISLFALQQDISINLLEFTSGRLQSTGHSLQTDEPRTYREYRLEKGFIIIQNEQIEYKRKLTERQEELVKNGGLEEINRDGIKSLYDRKILSIPIELENVGNGVALHFRVGLYKSKEEEPKFILPVDLKVGEKMYIHIFSENYNNSIGEYTLGVYYEDILNNSYSQLFKFLIGKDETTGKLFSSLDLSGKQLKV